jgi:hypothetical protein
MIDNQAISYHFFILRYVLYELDICLIKYLFIIKYIRDKTDINAA